MLPLGQKVIIVADSLEQNISVGDYGFIIAYDRNADNAFDYVVRLPKINKHVCLPSVDVELEEVILQREAALVERESLIDFALATHNEQLFRRLMKSETKQAAVETNKETKTADDFVKQISLKSWI